MLSATEFDVITSKSPGQVRPIEWNGKTEAMTLLERRPKLADVAAKAGVSTATVDRVINGRGGVHQKTIVRVEQAIRDIVGSGDPQQNQTQWSAAFDIILAGDGSQVTKGLGKALVDEGESRGAKVNVSFVKRMSPTALAECLLACVERGSSGVAVQALDHVLVREAFERLDRAGIPVVTVLTDMAGVNRVAYVGLDNRAAGRTAGFLMGRFCRVPGRLAIVWGGQLYRSHEERESGFRNALRTDRPDLQCLGVITGDDDPEVTHARVRDAITEQTDLVGIYCVGGGITGVADAIDEAGLSQSLVMIGHNCNIDTKPYLLSGTIDAVIHQDTARIAEAAFKCLSERTSPPINIGIPIEIITRENVMYR